jgi:1-acyl-sn-glycerol-3-phosphate acyltransferase
LGDAGAATGRRKSEKTPIFRFLASIGLPALHAIAKFDVRGRENVPATGAFVLTPNHLSNIDPVIVGAMLYTTGRAPRFLAKASLFKVPVLRTLLRASGQVPVERTGTSRTSDPLGAASQIAKQGLAVIIYPEGSFTRDPDLWPMRGKSGAVRAALEQNIPVIPVAHWGDQKILAPYGKHISLFPRKRVVVSFGPPVDLSEFRGKPLDSSSLTRATAIVMRDITALLEDIRGEKAPEKRWDPAEHNQTEIGRIERA